jgi:hypothetical protein
VGANEADPNVIGWDAAYASFCNLVEKDVS